MRKYAVIVAGGNGRRMGTQVPKQFLLLKQKPVIWHTLHAFLSAYEDMQVILVLPEAAVEEGKAIIADIGSSERVTVAIGGATRFESVQNGLKNVTEPSIVFVHDGVRCLVTQDLIHRCYKQAVEKGSAIPAVPATDSIRITAVGNRHQVVDRSLVNIIQTPQTFLSSLLLPAFNVPFQESFTDEATVVEAAGTPIYLIDGDYNNIKITRPLDLFIADKMMD